MSNYSESISTAFMITRTVQVTEENDQDVQQEGLINDHVFRILIIVLFVVLCKIVSVFGTIANIVNLIVLLKIGFTDTIYITLTALAFTDLGTCFFLILATIALNPWFLELNLPFNRIDLHYLTSAWPHLIFARMTTILTAFISFERCLCVVLPLKVKKIITRKVVKGVVGCTLGSGVLKAVLLYSTTWYEWQFYPDQNKTLIGVAFSHNREEVESVYYPILFIAVPFVSCVIVIVSAALLVSALRKNSKWKQEAVYSNKSETDTDNKNPKLSTKEMRVARMVTNISIIYIVCSVPIMLFMFGMTADRSISITGSNTNFLQVMGGVFFFFQAMNSSCNIFVYYNNSSAYRTKFDQVIRGVKPKETE